MRVNVAHGAALALCALAIAPAAQARDTRLLVLEGHGRVGVRAVPDAPSLPSPAPAAASPRPAARAAGGAPKSGFMQALARLSRSHTIAPATYAADLADYGAARRSLAKLSGTRAQELGAVLGNLQHIAAAGMLTPSRLPALMLTLRRNRDWWTTGPLLSSGQRVSFGGSRLVWEYYPGQGIEIQWLGTFGAANGYFLSGHHDRDLAALLDEAVPLAAQRAGGIAWEYEFNFDGGSPPWVSSLAQGTAIQALARAGDRLHRADLTAAARSALGIFQAPPPQGIRIATGAGAHYLQYSYAPGERILNGFIQSLVGLYDYASLSQDSAGWALFNAGEAEARLEVPRYDTGAWSLYDQSSEDDLSYHELVTQFLQHLCERLRAAGSGGQSQAGGVGAGSSSRAGAATVYCDTASRFRSYLHRAPQLTLTPPAHARPRAGARIRFTLSKISEVTLTVRVASRVAFSFSGELAHGSHFLDWRPAHGGAYSVTLAATDLAGNSASVSAQGSVAPH